MKALSISCSDKGGCSKMVFLECNPHFILVLLGFHPMQQPQPDRPRLWGWLLPLAQGNPTILGGTILLERCSWRVKHEFHADFCRGSILLDPTHQPQPHLPHRPCWPWGLAASPRCRGPARLGDTKAETQHHVESCGYCTNICLMCMKFSLQHLQLSPSLTLSL